MLATLPTEIIIRILGYADPQSRIRCSSVNRRLNSIVDDSDDLQLQTECEIAGLICATSRPKHHFTQTQLQAVRTYQRAWRTMNWAQSVRSPGFGAWVDGYTMRTNSNPHLGPFFQTNMKPSSLDICRIPSPTMGITGGKWHVDDLGFCVERCVIDPGQDLLVAIERVPHITLVEAMYAGFAHRVFDYRIHFLSLATGKPHNLAVSPIFLSPNSSLYDGYIWPDPVLSIGCRHVAILLHLDTSKAASELWVIQWDTATIKVHAFQSPLPFDEGPDESRIRRRAISLAFLDPTSLVLSFIGHSSGESAELGIIRVTEDMHEGPLYELVCVIFELPLPRSSHHYLAIGAITSLHRPVLPLSFDRVDDCGLFYPAEKLRAFYYHLDMRRTASNEPYVSFQLIVTSTVLQNFYGLYLQNSGDLKGEHISGIKVKGHTLIIPWKAWGKETRLLHESVTTHGEVSTSNNRLMFSQTRRRFHPPAQPVVIRIGGGPPATPPPQEQSSGGVDVEMVLFDFSRRLALQRDMHVFSSEEANDIVSETEYHLDLEVVEDTENIWEEPIETGLPYRKTVMNLHVSGATHTAPTLAIFDNGIGIAHYRNPRETEWEISCV